MIYTKAVIIDSGFFLTVHYAFLNRFVLTQSEIGAQGEEQITGGGQGGSSHSHAFL